MKLNLFPLLCLTGVVSVTLQPVRHDYYLITTKETWSGAQTYCRKNYDDLATVQTDDDWERLNAEAARKGLPATGWVGLFDRVDSWYWNTVGPLWNTSLINWESGQPDNVGGNESCVAINSNGYWEDYPCANEKPFICYNATFRGFIAVPLLMRDWGGSLYYCQAHHTDLAFATNEKQNNELQDLASRQGTSWIGLLRGTWIWSDLTSISSLRWSPGFPNNVDHDDNCASANNSMLEDRQCKSLFYFFCHRKYTVRKQVVKLKIHGDKSVFDPAVQSAILQRIVQKLKEHGLWREINVTWVQSDGNIIHKKSIDGL